MLTTLYTTKIMAYIRFQEGWIYRIFPRLDLGWTRLAQWWEHLLPANAHACPILGQWMALLKFPLFCFVLYCYAFVQYCNIKTIQYNAMHTFVTVLNHPHNAARLRITEAMCSLSLLVFCIRELRFSPQNQSIQILISIRRIAEKQEPLFPRGAKTSHLSSICFWLEVSVQILHRKCR